MEIESFDQSKEYGSFIQCKPAKCSRVYRMLHEKAARVLPQGTRYEIREDRGSSLYTVGWYSWPERYAALADWTHPQEPYFERRCGFWIIGRYTVP